MTKKLEKELEKVSKLQLWATPNSGKSSLLNYLSKRDAAIVSEDSWNDKRCYRNPSQS